MISEQFLVEMTAENKAFSQHLPGLQVAWDSTSMGDFKTCPRKYYYSLICGWRSRYTSVHLMFGQLLHSSLEKYDHLRAEGQDYETALKGTIRWMLENTGERVHVCCYDHTHEIGDNKEACPVCGSAVMELFRPWQSADSNKNRATLIRTVVWYCEHFREDPAKTLILRNGKPAVELSFRMELPLISPEGQPYIACGHMDRVVEYNGNCYVLDRKTTKTTISTNFFDGFSPDNQMSLYQAAAQVVLEVPAKGVIIDAAQVGVNFSRFQRGFANRTKGQMEEYLTDFQCHIRSAERCAEERHWPMNDKSCHHYGGCQFRGICSKDASIRDAFLKTDFERRIWDPLVVRGE